MEFHVQHPVQYILWSCLRSWHTQLHFHQSSMDTSMLKFNFSSLHFFVVSSVSPKFYWKLSWMKGYLIKYRPVHCKKWLWFETSVGECTKNTKPWSHLCTFLESNCHKILILSLWELLLKYVCALLPCHLIIPRCCTFFPNWHNHHRIGNQEYWYLQKTLTTCPLCQTTLHKLLKILLIK